MLPNSLARSLLFNRCWTAVELYGPEERAISGFGCTGAAC